MTECTTESVPFSPLGRRGVLAEFSGGDLTSDAGALLLREADRRLGLIDALDAAIPDPRNPEMIVHAQRTLLAQRVLAIAMGHEDGNDHQALRDSPFWQAVTDRGPDPESPLAS